LVTWGSDIGRNTVEFLRTGRTEVAVRRDVEITTNYSQIESAMNSRISNPMLGGTNMAAGLDDAIQVLTAPGVSTMANRIIVLMTDGDWNQGRSPILSANDAAAAGVMIHTIGMLNNDTRPAPDWLEQMLVMAGWLPDIGMVGAKLLRAHCPGQIDSAGIALDRAGIAWDWRGGQADDPREVGPVEIFGPCGGAALYARRMLDELAGFDDDFFAYLEDVDLAWRGRLAGWQAYLQPRARVLHAHSSTLGDASPIKRFLLARNKVWLLAKNYPDPWLAREWPVIAGYDTLAVTWGMVRRRDLASLQGRLAGLRGLAPWLAKRRHVHDRWRDVDNWRRLLAPLVPPWAVPRRYAHLDQVPSAPP
jgi:GT2 family glycosyltransferase